MNTSLVLKWIAKNNEEFDSGARVKDVIVPEGSLFVDLEPLMRVIV